MQMLQMVCLCVSQSMGHSSLSDARYIPPHLRHKPHEDDKSSEENMRLIKQLKGLLNRLVEGGSRHVSMHY
jgi:hypothetical protein